MKYKVLAVVAHSDDESIGIGGTLARHSLSGDKVFAISLTNGVSSRKCFNESDIEDRNKAAKKASSILGFEWLESGMFPDNEMDTVSLLKVAQEIESAKDKVNPDIIYTHSFSDLNIDHQIINKAVLIAFRPQPNEIYKEIRTFEVASSTEYSYKNTSGFFYPNLFVNIKNTWSLKEKALKCYENELREKPHPRSLNGIKNLALLRGNQCGLELAEGFEVVRRILR